MSSKLATLKVILNCPNKLLQLVLAGMETN
jgi:hypothetical protein